MQTRDRQCFKVSSLACSQVANVSATNIVNENNVETSLIEFQGEPCKTPTVELIPPIFHNPFTFTFMVRRCTSKPLTPPLVLGKHAKMFPKKYDQNNSSHDEQRGFVGIIISTFPNFIWSIKKFQFLFTSLLLVPRPTYAVAPVKTPISDSEFTTLHFLGAGFRPSARIGIVRTDLQFGFVTWHYSEVEIPGCWSALFQPTNQIGVVVAASNAYQHKIHPSGCLYLFHCLMPLKARMHNVHTLCKC